MFERFTERARQVVVNAQTAAREQHHNYIGTEHILCGLIMEEEGLAARVLASMDVDLQKVHEAIIRIVGKPEDESFNGQLPFTPRGKKIFECSLREALSLGHNYIGTEHILLGLVREGEGVAMRILHELNVDSEKIRNEVIRMLQGPGGRKVARDDLPAQTIVGDPLTIKDAMFIENDAGYHVFTYDITEGEGRAPRAGKALISIPAGGDPLKYSYGDRVEIIIRKKG